MAYLLQLLVNNIPVLVVTEALLGVQPTHIVRYALG